MSCICISLNQPGVLDATTFKDLELSMLQMFQEKQLWSRSLLKVWGNSYFIFLWSPSVDTIKIVDSLSTRKQANHWHNVWRMITLGLNPWGKGDFGRTNWLYWFYSRFWKWWASETHPTMISSRYLLIQLTIYIKINMTSLWLRKMISPFSCRLQCFKGFVC